MCYLAYDPGYTTGFVKFTNDGEAADWEQFTLEEAPDHFERMRVLHEEDPILAVIYEKYILWKRKALQQSGSNLPASQVVGMIKQLASFAGVEPVGQDSNILGTAQKIVGMKMPSNHAQSHWVSAYLHGGMWLINQGIRKTALEREIDAKASPATD